MDSTLACYAGGRGSIPAVSSQQKIVLLPLGYRSQENNLDPDMLKWCSSEFNKQIKLKILAAPSVGEHGNKCEVWVAKKMSVALPIWIHQFHPIFIDDQHNLSQDWRPPGTSVEAGLGSHRDPAKQTMSKPTHWASLMGHNLSQAGH